MKQISTLNKKPLAFPSNQVIVKFSWLKIESQYDSLGEDGYANFLVTFFDEGKNASTAHTLQLQIAGDAYKRWGTMGSTLDAAYAIAMELMQAQGMDILLA
jgi:hypothetical protein